MLAPPPEEAPEAGVELEFSDDDDDAGGRLGPPLGALAAAAACEE